MPLGTVIIITMQTLLNVTEDLCAFGALTPKLRKKAISAPGQSRSIRFGYLFDRGARRFIECHPNLGSCMNQQEL
jgi:hypothetical protein